MNMMRKLVNLLFRPILSTFSERKSCLVTLLLMLPFSKSVFSLFLAILLTVWLSLYLWVWKRAVILCFCYGITALVTGT